MDDNLWLTSAAFEQLPTEKLREMVARHQRIFNSSSGYGFWDWNLDNDRFSWSGGFWAGLGYGLEDAPIINDSYRLAALIHPDDVEAARSKVILHLKEGAPINITFRVRSKSGRYHWSQCLADSVRDKKGRVEFLSGINFDISHLKSVEEAVRISEQRQRRIIQASNDGIWEWTAYDNKFFVSKKCFDQIGVSIVEGDTLEGTDYFLLFRNYIIEEDRDKFDLAWRDSIRNNTPLDLECRVVGGDRQTYWIKIRGQAFYNEENELLAFSGTNTDITALKKAEQKVIAEKENAEQANQAKSQFLSSMSHELRTPLNAILGFSQLMEKDSVLSHQNQQWVTEISRAGHHLLSLIDEVLDLAKIEAGHLNLSATAVSLSRTVENCESLVRPLLTEKNLTLTLNAQPDVFIRADEKRLKQVLLNLLSNAIKYNRDEGTIGVDMKKASPDFCTIAVRDSGVGINESQLSHLFEPFNRLGMIDSGVTGTGIGLTISKHLIEQMGGDISVTSQVGKGSEFLIRFPILEINGIETTSAEKLEYASVDELTFKKGTHVLYVEDNESNRTLMAGILKEYDQLQLTCCDHPIDALYQARNCVFDFILLDIDLPELSGIDLVKILRNEDNYTETPMVALSANAMKADRREALNSGFDAYLTKPLDISQLLGILQYYFGRNK